MADLRLKERYGGAALVTGASSGIGESFARRLAGEGMDLVLVARRAERLQALAAELESKHGVAVHSFPVDLTRPDCAEALDSELTGRGIEVGMLINNAGFGTYGLFHDLDPTPELQMVDLNCRAPVALTARLAPAMVERKRGAIVFLSSFGGYQPTPFFATYGATKAFNLMFGEALWAELAPLGVDVIVLSPGFTSTDFQRTAGVVDPKPPTGWSTPEEVVDVCLGKLGRTPSVVPGGKNRLAIWSVRLMPRKMAAKFSYSFSAPKD